MTADWTNLIQTMLIGLAALMMIGWVLAHLFLHSKATPVASIEELTARMGAGKPTLLYFYSNF